MTYYGACSIRSENHNSGLEELLNPTEHDAPIQQKKDIVGTRVNYLMTHVDDHGYSSCVAALFLVRTGALVSTTVFSLFGFAKTVPHLFILCSFEGCAAMWDSASTVLLSTLADRKFLADKITEKCMIESASDQNDRSYTDAHKATMKDIPSNQGSVMGLRALLQTIMACVGPFIFTVNHSEYFVVIVAQHMTLLIKNVHCRHIQCCHSCRKFILLQLTGFRYLFLVRIILTAEVSNSYIQLIA